MKLQPNTAFRNLLCSSKGKQQVSVCRHHWHEYEAGRCVCPTNRAVVNTYVSSAGAVFALSCLVLLQAVSSCPKECSCDAHTKVADCRGQSLYDVPRKLHQDTLELYLQNNRIRGLGSMSFRETPQLQILDLANNSISTISPSALLGLRGLRILSLANNSVREVDRRLLVSIRNLTLLDLSYNSIGGLPGALADSFHHLTHLSLHHNRLTKLDRVHLEALGNLKVLHLKGNPWRCDCHLIGLKLWLETFVFKGKKKCQIHHRHC